MSIAEPPPRADAQRFGDAQIDMAHGAGGKASRRLLEGLFAPYFGLSGAPLADAATIELDGARLAISTDAFVVRPLQFREGRLGPSQSTAP
jgi:hydrogenase expression/formation protein HypE